MWVRAANVGLIGLWVVWAALLVPWLVRGFTTDDGVAQGLVALLTVAWVAWTADLPAIRERLASPPEHRLPATVLALGAPIGALVCGSVHETLMALWVVIGGYGLAGLYVSPGRWRDLRPVVLLAVVVLPVLLIVDVILGWPLRKGIAWAAAAMLGGIPAETVIRVEGGMAHIDVPCAGFRGLWAFTALFLGTTLLRGRTVDRRWGAGLTVGFGVLVVANVGRVTAVVGIGHVLGWPVLAESVHQPLGVAGFLVALGSAAVIAGFGGSSPARTRCSVRAGDPYLREPNTRARVLTACVAAAIAAVLLRPVPAPVPAFGHPVAVPAGWDPIPPSAAELLFADQHGAGIAKARLPELGATLVLVESRSWLAHHVPEHCLRAAGWTVADDRPAWVDGRSIRVETVTRDGREATAMWWFQARDRTTDDLVVRIRDGWATGEPWVLVSVLIPGVHDPAELAELITSVRVSVDNTFEGDAS